MQNQLEPYQYELLAGIPQLYERLADMAKDRKDYRAEYAFVLCSNHLRASLANVLGIQFETLKVEEAEHENL